jgi:tetratricopeptide (TPR) repeat protein
MEFPHILILLSMIFIGRILLLFFHEMGHGLAGALFTKQPVLIFLGSHGNTEGNFTTTIGIFTFYIEYNPLKWKGGLCASKGGIMTFTQNILFIAAGPVFPVVIAYIYLVTAKNYLGEYFYVSAIFFFILSIFGMLLNLWPSKKMILLSTGNITRNDGYQLLTFFRHRNLYKEYSQAINHYNLKEYGKAIPYLKYLIDNGMQNEENIYSIAISAHLLDKDFNGAKEFIDAYTMRFTPTAADLINFGHYYSQTGNTAKAIEYYQKSLVQKETWIGYNNYGYSLNLQERYSEAVEYLDKAVAMAPKHAFPYNNRGLAKIKLGQTEEGLKDLYDSFLLDPENGYYFKNMGIYHFDRKEYKEALNFFEMAKLKDDSVYKIDDDIANTQIHLKQL